MRVKLSLVWTGMLMASHLLCQHLVITSPEGVEFAFGIDSIFYSRKWNLATAAPLKKEHSIFFVLLKKDSILLYKKVPSSPDTHHFVIEKGKGGDYALFYRGILNTLPDSVETFREKTSIHLSGVLTRKPLPALNASAPTPAQTGEDSQIKKPDTAEVYIADTTSQKTSDKTNTSPPVPQLAADPLTPPFEKTVEAVKKAEFEFERMLLIRDFVEKHKTNTRELKVFARLLTYDLTRLQLLRDCYAHTLDKINYKELTSVFDFEITKQSLLEFIEEHEKQ